MMGIEMNRISDASFTRRPAALTVPVLYIALLLRILEREPAHGEFIAEVFDFEIISYGPLMLLATRVG